MMGNNWKKTTSSRLGGLKRRDKACRLTLEQFRSLVYSFSQNNSEPGDDRALWRCHYCQDFLTLQTLTIDHFSPLHKGGRSVRENLTPCCAACNETKATLDGRSFIKLLETLAGLPADEQTDIKRRLRRGGKFFHSTKVRARA